MAPLFTQDLSLGATSSQVTELQQILTNQGDLNAPVTGYFGNLTKAAVIKFQAANGIPQLGIVGPSTRTALNAILNSGVSTGVTPTLNSTANSSAITQVKAQVQTLQTELTQLEDELATIS
jgi:peptidoglycan hydrolase-like protein with peptidoglycan-binding domain